MNTGSDPICPYCYCSFPDWSDVVPLDCYWQGPQDGESHTVGCPHCGKEFTFTARVAVTYTTTKTP